MESVLGATPQEFESPILRQRGAAAPVSYRPAVSGWCRTAHTGNKAAVTSPAPRRTPAHESMAHATGRRPDDHVIVMFGATGDLAKRKLLPGLFHLAQVGLMPERYRIVGTARRPVTDDQFREQARQAVAAFGRSKPEGDAWTAFAQALSFGTSQPVEPGSSGPLEAAVQQAEADLGGRARRLFHLAIPPVSFKPTVALLGSTGLAEGRSRIIIEKPFGTDLASAKELNHAVHQVFDESQIFRIDHFLGKESVNNILAFRFANGLSSRSDSPAHQLCADRCARVAVHRRARRLLRPDRCLLRHDRDSPVPGARLRGHGAAAVVDPRHLRAEQDKVYDSLRPVSPQHVVRGQSEGYRDEPGVAPGSDTETLAAVRVGIDNWRWKGVPFLLRSGKSMAAGQVITLGFHAPPLHMFRVDHRDAPAGQDNEIVIDFANPARSPSTSWPRNRAPRCAWAPRR